MNTRAWYRGSFGHWLVVLLMLAGGSSMATPARADVLDKFISAYTEIEHYAPAGSLPVKSADLAASRGLFNCLSDSSKDPVDCMNDFNDTPLGKQASDEAGIPESFWQVVKAYIAYKNSDYWGVAYHLGEAAVCAVVQVLLGGVDACSLVKELVELAKDLYNAGKAVVDFLEDVGGAALDAGKCILTLGSDCGDDSPPTPDEVFVYEYIFLPKIGDGVAKRELADGSYAGYVTGLVNNAKHKPYPVLSKPWPFGNDGMAGAKTMLYPHFTATAIANAKSVYEKAVDTNWSKDVLEKVLPQLGTERSEYLTSAVANVAKQAAQGYLGKQYTSPDAGVKFICYNHFTQDRPYRHVDQWILGHAKEAAQYKAVSSTDWCGNVFWGQKAGFAKYFRDYVVDSGLCPQFSGTLVCQSLSSYQSCAGLMGSVYQQAQCGMNVQHVGKGIAQEIIAWFKSRGSKYADSCKTPNLLSTPTSKIPATLTCHRPTLHYYCDKYYQDHYGTGAGKLPVKALECKLGATLPGDYAAKQNKLKTGMIPALLAKHSELQPYVAQEGYDPLRVLVPSKLYGGLKADAQALGFVVKTVLTNEPEIDGEEEPTLAGSMEGILRDKMKTVPADSLTPKPGGVNPPDPANRLTTRNPAAMTVTGAAAALNVPSVQGLGQTRALSGTLPGGAAPGTAVRGTPSVSATGAGTAGVAPAMNPPPGGVPAPRTPPTMLHGAGLPDLDSDARVIVGNSPVQWGATVSVDSKDAVSIRGGVCEIAVQYTVRNDGPVPSGTYDSQWRIGRFPVAVRSWNSIAANGRDGHREMLALRAGLNEVLLTLDPLHKLQETSATNNQFRLRINVTGNCSNLPAVTPGAAPLPLSPRVPAIQRPPGTVAPAPAGRLMLPAR